MHIQHQWHLQYGFAMNVQRSKMLKGETHCVASTATYTDDLDDTRAQASVGHKGGTGVLLVHGTDGAIRPLGAEARELSPLGLPSPGHCGREQVISFVSPSKGDGECGATAAAGGGEGRARRRHEDPTGRGKRIAHAEARRDS